MTCSLICVRFDLIQNDRIAPPVVWKETNVCQRIQKLPASMFGTRQLKCGTRLTTAMNNHVALAWTDLNIKLVGATPCKGRQLIQVVYQQLKSRLQSFCAEAVTSESSLRD